jgi:tRNA pseudouridine13 synthase
VLLDDYDTAIALILGRPGSLDHADVLRARQAFENGDYRTAMLTWPRAFPEQIRVAKEMVRTGGDAQRAWRAVDQTLRKLYTSAFQSDLLNRVIAQRIDSIDRVLVGDLAWKHINGACFRVEDADVEQPRCASFEISPTGPLFGPRMTEPTGYPAQVETQVLADAGLTRDQVRGGYSVKLEGARRPLRVPIRDVESHNGTDANGPFLRVAFVLPPGAYATSVTRELCRGVASMPPPQPHSAPASQANP